MSASSNQQDSYDDEQDLRDEEENYTAGDRALQEQDALVDDDPDPEFEALDLDEENFEPSYKVANSLLFSTFAKRLEDIFNSRHMKGDNGPSKQDKLLYFLPPRLLQQFTCPNDNASNRRGSEPQSIYPLLRLLLPGKDGHRGNFNVKESKLAAAYIEAHDLSGESKHKLLNYHDPAVCDKKDGVGDFPKVLETVLRRKLDSNEAFYEKFKQDRTKGFTVGQVNDLLDQLAGLHAKTHEMNEKLAARATGDAKPAKVTFHKVLVQWVRSLNPYMGNSNIWGLSSLEHKWLNRIILGGAMKTGFGEDTIMEWYSTLGRALWDAHNSLKAVCNKLVNPTFVNSLRQPTKISDGHAIGLHNFMTSPAQPISFGVPFIPMCSAKSSLTKTMELLSDPHRKFDDALDKIVPFKKAIALRNPAFTIETKLDGERQVVHFSRDGVVRIQSRRSNWFSDLYSPVLGPPLRKALEKHGLDIVLDGEILAYCGEKDGNQFGLNRTVAKKRREWMEAKGLIDARDLNIHTEETEYKSMNPTSFQSFTTSTYGATELDDNVSGEKVWLTYVIFDVLYVCGPGASELLDETVSKCISPRPTPGSLIDLSAMERKKVLYRLVDVQDNIVEIVDTQVVRPTGELVEGRDYFSYDNPHLDAEAGVPASTVDSLDCLFGGYSDELLDLDKERRIKVSEEERCQVRALKCDLVYRKTVDDLCLEGIMFKMLSSPYILGAQSRPLRYWLKLKPDYGDGSTASDMDLVIIGGYFATGLAKAGTPSAFLVACRDSMNPGYYMPFCKVNAAVKGDVYARFYERTGCKDYHGNLQEEGNCKWFSSKAEPPDFVSNRSYQRNYLHADFDGWKSDKSTFPHIWISPEHSEIVTVKAGEIIRAGSFPPGVTLRHPRIEKFRNETIGDEKDLSSIECDQSLRDIYQRYTENRSTTFNSNALSSEVPRGINSNQPCLFLTESQCKASTKKRIQRNRQAPRALRVAAVDSYLSKALEGATFCVLPGVYRLSLSPTDTDLGRDEGWLEEAMAVTHNLDVSTFIKRHGGTVKLSADANTLVLGGRAMDQRVESHMIGINEALAYVAKEKPSAIGKTKKSGRMHEQAKQKGVIRWTFVYSAIARWNYTEPDLDATILSTSPELLEPHVLDYLARSDESCEDKLSELCQMDLVNELQLRRALDTVEVACVQSSKRPKTTWQEEPMRLTDDERLILNGGQTNQMFIYPDVFLPDDTDAVPESSTLGETLSATTDLATESLRPDSDTIMAVLPLAHTMGATILSCLSPHVTHVVCDLVEANDGPNALELTTRQAKADHFASSTNSHALIQQVLDLERTSDSSITFVSPNWVRTRYRDWTWA